MGPSDHTKVGAGMDLDRLGCSDIDNPTMKSKIRIAGRVSAGICLIGVVACSSIRAGAEEEHVGGEILLKIIGAFADKDRPVWNQEKAEAILNGIIAEEDKGNFAWDKIAWETDVQKAVARARKEQKPIFSYLFLKRDVGPKNAPC